MSCKRFMIAAPKSGSGKTILTCALLNILKKRGLKTVSFKCGPDYIDPIFHSTVLGIKSRNIDSFMADEKMLLHLFEKNSKDCDIALIEGVMGYYDGLGGKTDAASSYDIAKITQTPVVLVLDAKGSSLTAAALIKGMANFRDDSNIKAVVLNRVSESTYLMLKDIIEKETGVYTAGYIPEIAEAGFESRYLGLKIYSSQSQLLEKIKRISSFIEKSVDIDYLLDLAESAPEIKAPYVNIRPIGENIKIAAAYDEAFNFYYEDNFELLKSLGAEIEFFSPLKNEPIPLDSCGLIIGGGYPELFAIKLSENIISKKSVKSAVLNGMPTIAECGGFMYLNSIIENQEGSFEMCGAFNGKCRFTGKLSHFGYETLISQKEGLFGKIGTVLKGHEFHYYDSENEGNGFSAVKPVSNRKWECVNYGESIYAGFPHLYLYSNISAAESFIKKCCDYKSRCLNEFR